LDVKPEALSAIAQLALERKTGARGLRAILVRFCLCILQNMTLQNKNEKLFVFFISFHNSVCIGPVNVVNLELDLMLLVTCQIMKLVY
jgi:hypothetical protein